MPARSRYALKNIPLKKFPKFATSIACMDGRIQEPIIKFLRRRYRVDFVDIITEPGPIKYLAGNVNHAVVETIKKRVKISVLNHRSHVVAVSGHFDCAGNPVERKKQVDQINKSVKLLRSWHYEVKILKLWVDEFRKIHILP